MTAASPLGKAMVREKECTTHILEVTFVDDECMMLAADDPDSLAAAIDCCTLVLSTTFQLLKLEVDWRPRKSECLVQMVEKLGRDIVEKWRCDDGSQCRRSLSTRGNGCDGERQRRSGRPSLCESTKESYGPLALRIFGSGYISTPAEAVTVHALGRVSQLLFNAHCTTVIQRFLDCCFCVQPRIAQDSWRPKGLRETNTL